DLGLAQDAESKVSASLQGLQLKLENLVLAGKPNWKSAKVLGDLLDDKVVAALTEAHKELNSSAPQALDVFKEALKGKSQIVKDLNSAKIELTALQVKLKEEQPAYAKAKAQKEGVPPKIAAVEKVLSDLNVAVTKVSLFQGHKRHDGWVEYNKASPNQGFEMLMAWLAKRATGANKNEFITAVSVVGSRRYGIPTLSSEALAEVTDPKVVIDHLLGALHHEYIQALLAGGKHSQAAKNLEEAYESAVSRRATLMEILPASAYLRTSFPTTSLQGDPELGWANMLGESGARTIPFLSHIRNAIFPNRDRDQQVQAEIDKQNWQNVNRVRVRGKGRSNYVIAKDPLGNWYVKSYSADPSKVLQSARNLGLMAMGGKSNVDLLSRAQRIDAQVAGEAIPPDAVERTGLGRLAKRQGEEYHRAVLAIKSRLKEDLEAQRFVTRITVAWNAIDIDETREGWDTARKAAVGTNLSEATNAAARVVDLTNASTEDDDALAPTLEALSGVLRFYSALDGSLESQASEALTESAKSSAALKAAEDKLKADQDALAVLEKKLSDTAKVTVKGGDLESQISKQKLIVKGAVTARDNSKTADDEAKAVLRKTQEARSVARNGGRTAALTILDGLDRARESYERALDFISSSVVADDALPPTPAPQDPDPVTPTP
ncbi:MAG: hypothetical protein ACI9X4_001952, partial [Glaciecola sp.]